MKLINKIIKSEKIRPRNLVASIKTINQESNIFLKWSSNQETKNNFGDALNPWLFEKITKSKPKNANNLYNIYNYDVYSAIGSILDNNKTRNLIVWGSGFKFSGSTVNVKPKKILSVRGPLSRQNFLRQGISCPKLYGDPALIVPYFYKPLVEKKYKLGIIAHYIDKNNINYMNLIKTVSPDILILDIEESIETIIEDILKCEKIASSSLHGLIVADAYGVPSRQIKFSDNIVGGDFKFKDYMYSVNREYIEPLIINNHTNVDDILTSFDQYSIDIDTEKILQNCPFFNLTSS